MLDCSWRCDDILGEHINLKTAERPIQCVECVEESSPILTEEALSKNCIVSTKRHFCLEEYTTQLSPGIILMSGGAHDGGMLQSSLFTSRSQNQVLGKLRSSGF